MTSADTEQAKGNGFRADVAPLALVLVVVALTFGATVAFPFVNWDDGMHVGDNTLTLHPLGQGLAALFFTRTLGYPVPALVLSFALDRALFGLHAGAFHAVNVALHLYNVALVSLLARRLGLRPFGAAIAALVFGAHPVVAEPVSWVTGRKDVLATAFLLSALHVYLRARSRPRGAVPVALATLLATLAILTKPSAVVAPVLLAWVASQAPSYAPQSQPLSQSYEPRARSPLRDLVPLAPLAVIASLLTVLGVSGQRAVGAVVSRDWPTAAGDVAGALALHLDHLANPFSLLAAYYRTPGDPSVGAMIVASAICTFVLVAALRVGARVTLLRTGVIFFFLAYVPASNLLGGFRWVADSYLYLPLVGLALCVGLAADRARRLLSPRLGVPLALAFGFVLLLLCHLQTRTWASSVALWLPVEARYPNVVYPLATLANAYRYDRRDDEAADAYVALENRFPDFSDARDDEVWAHLRRGEEGAALHALERGVFEHNPGCLRMFWVVTLAADSPPAASERAVVREAFVAGFADLERNPTLSWQRIEELLTALGLPDEAKQAHAERLRRSGAP